jgi:hypothetical protein
MTKRVSFCHAVKLVVRFFLQESAAHPVLCRSVL